MIVLVTGKIGGGKTYWAVNYLVQKFYIYRDELFQFVPRSDVVVVSNIRDLELEHKNLDDEISKLGVQGVFSKSYVDGKSVVFIIDEAQKIFDRKFYNKDVFSFFQMSRHYGVDIVLITQDVESLAKELRTLYEYEIRSIARSQRLRNTFMYKYYSHDEVFKRQNINFDKKIGVLYKSQFRDESEKVPRVWGKYLILGLVMFAVALYGVSRLVNLFGGNKEKVLMSQNAVKAEKMTDQEVKELTKEKDTVVAVVPVDKEQDQEKVSGASRLWNGDTTLEVAYDVEKDFSYYVLKESGKTVGFVKVDGMPKKMSGADCSSASVICKNEGSGSALSDWCGSCGHKIQVKVLPASDRLSADHKPGLNPVTERVRRKDKIKEENKAS